MKVFCGRGAVNRLFKVIEYSLKTRKEQGRGHGIIRIIIPWEGVLHSNNIT